MELLFEMISGTSQFQDAGGNAIMKNFSLLNSSVTTIAFDRADDGTLKNATEVGVNPYFGGDVFTGGTSRRTGICGDALSNDYFWISQPQGNNSPGVLNKATMISKTEFSNHKVLGNLSWAGISHIDSYNDLHHISVFRKMIYLLVRDQVEGNKISIYRRGFDVVSDFENSWEVVVKDIVLQNLNKTNRSVISASFIVGDNYYGLDSFDSSTNKSFLIFSKQFEFIARVRPTTGPYRDLTSLGNWSADDKGRIYGSSAWHDDSLRTMNLPSPFHEVFRQSQKNKIIIFNDGLYKYWTGETWGIVQ